MLVLKRKELERILLTVGGPAPVEIELTVVEIDRNMVRLGFEAPPEVKIMRRELVRKVPAAKSKPAE